MKRIITIALVITAFASCKLVCPKMYTTFGKEDGRIGSFYSMKDIPLNTDTVIEGRKVTIIQVN